MLDAVERREAIELLVHPDRLPSLARLIVQASKRCQMIVVSHAAILVSALDAEARQIVLEKETGETTVQDGVQPNWM